MCFELPTYKKRRRSSKDKHGGGHWAMNVIQLLRWLLSVLFYYMIDYSLCSGLYNMELNEREWEQGLATSLVGCKWEVGPDGRRWVTTPKLLMDVNTTWVKHVYSGHWVIHCNYMSAGIKVGSKTSRAQTGRISLLSRVMSATVNGLPLRGRYRLSCSSLRYIDGFIWWKAWYNDSGTVFEVNDRL